jgi:hypothetical protein
VKLTVEKILRRIEYEIKDVIEDSFGDARMQHLAAENMASEELDKAIELLSQVSEALVESWLQTKIDDFLVDAIKTQTKRKAM